MITVTNSDWLEFTTYLHSVGWKAVCKTILDSENDVVIKNGYVNTGILRLPIVGVLKNFLIYISAKRENKIVVKSPSKLKTNDKIFLRFSKDLMTISTDSIICDGENLYKVYFVEDKPIGRYFMLADDLIEVFVP